jgi:NDP-sugar pyrophosphorylase family protein
MKINSILILAAGMGTRLRPLTNDLPKSLLTLGDTNILRNLIVLSQNYFPNTKIYVNTSFLAEKVISEVSKFPLINRPYIIWEPSPLGPAFTVSEHCKRTNHNVLVIHGDTYFSDLAFSQFANSINQKKKDVSILLCHQRTRDKARSEIVEKAGVIFSITEKYISESNPGLSQSLPNENVWSSSGAIVVKRNALLNFSPELHESLSPTLINYIAFNETLHLEKCTSDRISIDDEKSYLEAIKLNKSNPRLFDRSISH